MVFVRTAPSLLLGAGTAQRCESHAGSSGRMHSSHPPCHHCPLPLSAWDGNGKSSSSFRSSKTFASISWVLLPSPQACMPLHTAIWGPELLPWEMSQGLFRDQEVGVQRQQVMARREKGADKEPSLFQGAAMQFCTLLQVRCGEVKRVGWYEVGQGSSRQTQPSVSRIPRGSCQEV